MGRYTPSCPTATPRGKPVLLDRPDLRVHGCGARLTCHCRSPPVGSGSLGRPRDGPALGRRVPPEGTTYAASWPGVDVIGDQRVMIDAPSQPPGHLVAANAGRRLVLHAMHSVVDWLAFAVWEDGRLIRSLSLSPDSGIIENIGEPLPFEMPYWAGDRSAGV
ncbi:DUF6928 family protein [Streptomyces althioticus]|uniref:DUF6928 family protein n=1 Tax=Streptomyces althioticus group TaxID=2867194 RepID=UPI00378A5678